MTRDIWQTSHTRLFRVTDWTEYLSAVALHSLDWSSEVERICAHCSSVQNGGKCPNCGAVDTETIQFRTLQARAVLGGYLPEAAILADVSDGVGFDITHGVCGDPSLYREEDVILRLGDCEIIRKSIPSVQALSYDDAAIMMFIVEMDCTVDLIVPNEGQKRKREAEKEG